MNKISTHLLTIHFHVYEEATCLEDPANTQCSHEMHAGMQFLSFEFSEYYCTLTVVHPLHSMPLPSYPTHLPVVWSTLLSGHYPGLAEVRRQGVASPINSLQLRPLSQTLTVELGYIWY